MVGPVVSVDGIERVVLQLGKAGNIFVGSAASCQDGGRPVGAGNQGVSEAALELLDDLSDACYVPAERGGGGGQFSCPDLGNYKITSSAIFMGRVSECPRQ